MAAPDLTVANIGQNEGSGSTTALFQDLFAPSVIETYMDNLNISAEMAGFCDVVDVTGAGSFTWKINGEDQFTAGGSNGFLNIQTFDKGEYRLGQSTQQKEVQATVDAMSEDNLDIAIEDVAQEHTDIVARKFAKLGFALSRAKEQKIALALTQASLTSEAAGITQGGNNVVREATSPSTGLVDFYTNDSTGAERFIQDLNELAYLYDTKFVPDTRRVAWIDPYIRQILANNTNIFDRDYSSAAGDVNQRAYPMLAGFEIRYSNNLPQGNIQPTASGGILDADGELVVPAFYQGDYRYNAAAAADGRVVCLTAAMSPAQPALGVVKDFDLTTRAWYNEDVKSYRYSAYERYGMNTLFPESAGTITVKGDA